MTEQWKSIPGYEGIYEASNLGRIRTAAGKTTYTERRGVRRWKQRIIKQHFMKSKRKNGTRYDARCTLWKDGIPKYYLVARLIAMAWCDGYKDGLTVNHIDGNPLNNCAENLEWLTLGDNVRHGFRTGLYKNNQKPVVLNIDGVNVSFDSLAEASRRIGHRSSYVSDCLKSGKAIVPRAKGE